MNRRQLLAAFPLASSLTLASAGAWAQAVPTIGILVISDVHFPQSLFEKAMQAFGRRPGSYRLEIRSAQGRLDRLDELARELAAAKVSVIVSFFTPAALAAKRATTTIPVVMSAGDPVGNGIVASTSRPGGNITGVDSNAALLSGKRVELLREVVPSMRRLGVFINPPDPFSRNMTEQVHAVAGTINLAVEVIAATDPDQAMRDAVAAGVDAIVVQPSLPQRPIAERLLRARLPGVSGERQFVEAGGLLTVNASIAERAEVVAQYVDRILKGAAPRDLPVQQVNRFDILVNRGSARALGITLPPLLLNRAEEIID